MNTIWSICNKRCSKKYKEIGRSWSACQLALRPTQLLQNKTSSKPDKLKKCILNKWKKTSSPSKTLRALTVINMQNMQILFAEDWNIRHRIWPDRASISSILAENQARHLHLQVLSLIPCAQFVAQANSNVPWKQYVSKCVDHLLNYYIYKYRL